MGTTKNMSADTITVVYKNLTECMENLEIFFEDIARIWQERGGPPGIRDTLRAKVEMIRQEKIKGIVLFNDKLPLGLAWVEKVGQHYGNVMLHTIGGKHKEELIVGLEQSGAISDVLAELIQFEENEEYRELLVSRGYKENARQRMALDFREYTVPEPPEPPEGVDFTLSTMHTIPISSQISMDAHKISKDQEFAPDLRTMEKRIDLETVVFGEKYGPLIQPATLFVTQDGKPVGQCIVVEIPCWGFDAVPWVFDVAVRPECMGKGLGRLVFHKSMYELQELGYEIVGLAVTLGNESAIKLYESLGFFFVEKFSEFINPNL